jgi:hypothetical protein
MDVFPGAWDKLDSLADSGLLASAEMVFEELGRQDDEVLDWAKQHTEIFLPLDEAVQIEVRRILENHINFIDLKRQKSEADPFVVATAVVKGCTVVTEEKPSGGPDKKKIPDVCKTEGLTCIPVLEMLRREGLRLG